MKYLCYLMLLVFFFGILGSTCATSENEMDNSTVNELDLDRYMGLWYEIARFDHNFERGLVGVTAEYQMRPDGKISVINRGYKNSLNGKLKVAKGKAKQPNPDEPGKLKVSFFLFFYAGYYVMELDPDYQWALIGSSTEKYLWILSRTPQLTDEVRNNILKLAEARGYDTGKLIWVKQPES